MTGRKRKPTQLRVIQGTARKDRLRADEPEPERLDGDIDPPAWLSERAREIWAEIIPELQRMNVFTRIDVMAAAHLCDAQAQFLECRAVIARDGRTYTSATEKGEITRPRPEVLMGTEAERRVRALMVEFGMTPSSRTRVKAAAPQKKKSALEEFIGG